MGRRVRLPRARRSRSLVAVAGYLVVVALGAALLTTSSQGLGGVLLSVGWALVLLVPLVMVAVPTPPDRPAGHQDHLPVLMRSKAARRDVSS